MQLKSPPGLHYPITVAKLRKRPNDAIKKQDVLFEYTYVTQVTEVDRFGEEEKVDKAFYSTFESTVDGTLVAWDVAPDSVINSANIPLTEVEEECTHSVQYGGMCVNCGKDMTTMDYTASAPETSRVSTTVTPNHQALRISNEEAARSDEEAKQRLLDRRKLSLVVDLDLTIIHASVDPTIKEWMDDEHNPNHPAVSDVRVFDLYDDALQRNVSYYIKLRPGLYDFLQTMSRLYELYIYTMGTRAYAENIAKLIDPDKKLFGERILSRTETPREISKNLRKLFPVDNRMVVIIDDRADVWNWSNYLVRVKPFNFFVGIGDINSSFLPKQQDTPKPSIDVPDPEQVGRSDTDGGAAASNDEGDAGTSSVGPIKLQRSPTSSSSSVDSEGDQQDGNESALGQLVSMQENTDESDIQRKTAEQDENLAAQINERPLLQMQKNLEKQEEEAAAAAADSVESDLETELTVPDSRSTSMERTRSTSRPPVPQTLLKNTDTELSRIEAMLTRIQNTFYNMFDERMEEDEGRTSGPRLIPDVKDVIEQHRFLPLRECGVVFTRLVPLDIDVMKTRWADMAMRLGAVVQTDLRSNTTHVICKPGDPTSKMREAAQKNIGRREKGKQEIHIVSVDWLLEAASQWWHRVTEEPFLIPVEPANKKRKSSGTNEDNDFSDTLGDSAANSVIDGEEEVKLRIQTDGLGDDDDDEDGHGRLKSPEEEEAEWEEAFKSEEDDFSDSDEDGEDESLKSSQGESVASASHTNGVSTESKKRRRDDDSDQGSDSDASSVASAQRSKVVNNLHGSELQRRKKRALERTSSLTRVSNAISSEDVKLGKHDAAAADEDDDGLEAAFLEELGDMNGGGNE